MRNTDLTGLILAGGQSRRFGRDKARHRLGGRPMIEHVYEVLAAVTPVVLVSVQSDEARFEELPVQHVPDVFAGCGPLAGLHAGLWAATTPWVLAVACDLPLITSVALQALIEARSAGAMAVLARADDGRAQPLCACYHRQTRAVAERHLAAGQRAMRDFVRQLPAVTLVDLPAGALRNVNRPSDLPDIDTAPPHA